MTHHRYVRRPGRTIRIRRIGGMAVLVAIVGVAAAAGYQLLPAASSTARALKGLAPTKEHVARGVEVPDGAWSEYGQAAVQIGESRIQAGPNQHAAPIASVAKVMTAYLVLRDRPLGVGEQGPTITITAADVADTDRRSRQRQSVVPVVAGEQLTELQALQALLLPSANNIAAVLARWDSGSETRFVARMNAAARSLGMRRTHYSDPSGYDPATVSTAADQVRIVVRAMRLPVFARIVATPAATLPVAGTVHNTNRLLGRDGFVGVKTGSDNAAGGCFAFRAIRSVNGRRTTITGVVLGQPGHDRIDAGLAAADAMVARIAGDRSPSAPPALGPPGALPRMHTLSTQGGNP